MAEQPEKKHAAAEAAGVISPGPVDPATVPATVIVFGNEKGGSGKSTCSMHVVVALLRIGYRVGSVDLDMRQWSLTRYLSNRAAMSRTENVDVPMPVHVAIARSDIPDRREAEAADRQRFEAELAKLRAQCDFVVIDCPGTDSFTGRLAHGYADKLVTPINDSFIDFDMLARVDSRTGGIIRPSVYAEMVWEARKQRALREGRPFDWIVMRNRLSNLAARNKQEMEQAVSQLAGRLGFRVAPGFSERVIFRELFLRGMTMFDLFEGAGAGKSSVSHVAARYEVRELLNALRLPRRTPTPRDRASEYDGSEAPV